jgi:hypothetical protein
VEDPTDAQEARRARAHAQEKLAEAKARQGKVTQLVGKLSRHLEENHFADRLSAALGKDGTND